MASTYTNAVSHYSTGGYAKYCGWIEGKITSQTATACKITIKQCAWMTQSYGYKVNVYSQYYDDSTGKWKDLITSSGSLSSNPGSSWKYFAGGTYTGPDLSRGSSDKTYYFRVAASCPGARVKNHSDGSYTDWAYITVTVPALNQYAIGYEPNQQNVENMPDPYWQAASTNTKITITSTVPTKQSDAVPYIVNFDAQGGIVSSNSETVYDNRTYTFSSWNTEDDGSGTSYVAGEKYPKTGSTPYLSAWLYAQWTETYTAPSLTLPTPTRTGYEFLGWNTAPDVGESTSNITGNYQPTEEEITFYAQWRILNYNVQYNANGGTGAPAAQTKVYGENLTLSNTTPTKNAATTTYKVTFKANGPSTPDSSQNGGVTTTYTFSKWNTAQNGSGTSYNRGGTYSANAAVTLYAQWTSSSQTTSVTLPTLTWEGDRSFLGWYTAASGGNKVGDSGDSYTPTSNVTLYAHWNIGTYNVTYNANGGSSTPTAQTKVYGENLTLRGAISKNSSSTTYTITFNAQGGTSKTSSLTATKTITYTFAGWNTAADGTGTTYAASGTYSANTAVTLYAKWTESSSTSSVILPDIQRTGYTFNGWYTAASGGTRKGGIGSSYTPTDNTTLYAQWTVNTYTISYNINGGDTAAPQSQSSNYGGSITINNGNGLTRNMVIGQRTLVNGYIFNGWNTQTDGKGTSYTAGSTISMPASNLVLYAQWKENTYTIEYYYYNNKTDSPNSTWKEAIGTSTTLTNPSRTELSYIKVTFNPNGGTLVNSASSISTQKTVTYTFTGWKNRATNGIYAGGSSYTENQSVKLEETWKQNTVVIEPIEHLPRATYQNFDFDGWYDSQNGGKKVGNVNDSYSPTYDKTLYARWIQNTYTVQYDVNDPYDGTSTEHKITNITNPQQQIPLTRTDIIIPKEEPRLIILPDPDNPNATKYDITFNYQLDDIVPEKYTVSQSCKFKGWGLARTGSSPLYKYGTTYNHYEVQDTSNTIYFYAYWEEPLEGIELPVPDMDKTKGYVFTGWYLDADCTQFIDDSDTGVQWDNPLKEDIILYAGWKQIEYRINYDANSGEESSLPPNLTDGKYGDILTVSSVSPIKSAVSGTYTLTFQDGENTLSTQNFETLSNFAFKEWNTAQDGTGDTYFPKGIYQTTESNNIAIEQDDGWVNTLILYAQWTEQVTAPVISLPVLESSSEKIFGGWGVYITAGDIKIGEKSVGDTAYTPTTDDITLKAIWYKSTYEVKYNANGGNINTLPTPNPATKEYGVPLTISNTVPERSFTPKEYNITFVTNSDISLEPAEVTPNYTYTFTGWNTAANGRGAAYASQQTYLEDVDITLYAQWSKQLQPNSSTILPDLNDDQQYLQMPGYEFKGWYKDKDCTLFLAEGGAEYCPEGDITNIIIYAKWGIKGYTISYTTGLNPQNKEIQNVTKTLPKDQVLKHYETIKLSKVKPVYVDHVFEGWLDNGELYQPGDVYPKDGIEFTYADHTLTAKWGAITTLTEWLSNWEQTPADIIADRAGNDITLWTSAAPESRYQYQAPALLFATLQETINNVEVEKNLGYGYKLKLDLINPYQDRDKNTSNLERLNRTIFVPAKRKNENSNYYGYYKVPAGVKVSEISLFDNAQATISYKANVDLDYANAKSPRSYEVVDQVMGQIENNWRAGQDVSTALKQKYYARNTTDSIIYEYSLDSWNGLNFEAPVGTQFNISILDDEDHSGIYSINNKGILIKDNIVFDSSWPIDKCIVINNVDWCSIGYKANIIQKTYSV